MIDTYRRLGDELAPRWNLHIEFSALRADPAGDRSPNGRAVDPERHRRAGAP